MSWGQVLKKIFSKLLLKININIINNKSKHKKPKPYQLLHKISNNKNRKQAKKFNNNKVKKYPSNKILKIKTRMKNPNMKKLKMYYKSAKLIKLHLKLFLESKQNNNNHPKFTQVNLNNLFNQILVKQTLI